jgi:hypothetical protein
MIMNEVLMREEGQLFKKKIGLLVKRSVEKCAGPLGVIGGKCWI